MNNRPREFKLRRFPPIQLLLYLILRTVLMVVDMFPYSMAPQVGKWLGRIMQFVGRKHRGIAVKNLERSRGICPPDSIPEFIDRVYNRRIFDLGITNYLNRRRVFGSQNNYKNIVTTLLINI